MSSKFTQIYDDQWFEWPAKSGNQFQCCDCHLVHSFSWRVVKGKLQMKMRCDNRATANCRRASKKPDANSSDKRKRNGK